jgi:hypothetical protein
MYFRYTKAPWVIMIGTLKTKFEMAEWNIICTSNQQRVKTLYLYGFLFLSALQELGVPCIGTPMNMVLGWNIT